MNENGPAGIEVVRIFWSKFGVQLPWASSGSSLKDDPPPFGLILAV